jgi:large conductance mechanosensitive channel
MIGGKQAFGELSFTINNTVFPYGFFLNAFIAFVIVAAVVFFLVLKPVNVPMERMQTSGPVDKETRECPACLSQIPYAARRCAFCTEEVGAAPVPVTA